MAGRRGAADKHEDAWGDWMRCERMCVREWWNELLRGVKRERVVVLSVVVVMFLACC